MSHDPSNLPGNDNWDSCFKYSVHETEKERGMKDGKVVVLINIHSYIHSLSKYAFITKTIKKL